MKSVAETKKAPCGTFDFGLFEAFELAKMVGDASFELATPHSVKTMAVCQFIKLNQRLI